MKKLISIILCALLLIGLVPVIALAAEAAPAASITAVSGTVRVKRGNSEKEISAFIGMKIKKDDTITTGAKGAVTIDIGDDKVIKASANSSFSITTLKDNKGVAQVGFTLIYGTVFNSVSKAQTSDDNYTVQAGNTVMGVRGTKFTVFYFVEDGVAKYRIVTTEGTVYIRTLVPKTMNDNNNILDIKDGVDVGAGQSFGTGKDFEPDQQPREMKLEDLSRYELEAILGDKDAPEDLKKAIEDILENMPPEPEEEPKNKKIVFDKQQPVPTGGIGGQSGSGTTSPPTTSPAVTFDIGADLNAYLQGPSGTPFNLDSAYFGTLSPVKVLGALLNSSLLGNPAGPYQIILDHDITIDDLQTIKVTGSNIGKVEFIVSSSGSLTVEGELDCGVLINNGTINNNSNTINIINGSFINEVGATLVNIGTEDIIYIDHGGFENKGTIENHGTIHLTNLSDFENQSDTSSDPFTGVIYNYGIISIGDNSSFTNDGELTSTGTIQIADSGNMTANAIGVMLLSGTVRVIREGAVFKALGSLTIDGNTLFEIDNTGVLSDQPQIIFSDITFAWNNYTVSFDILQVVGSPSSTITFNNSNVFGALGAKFVFHNNNDSTVVSLPSGVVNDVPGLIFWTNDGLTPSSAPSSGLANNYSREYNWDGTSKWLHSGLADPSGPLDTDTLPITPPSPSPGP